MPKRHDLWATPAGEACLLLVVSVLGWATQQPLIFASLGPTAYELVEQPGARSARAYNIIVGHFLGLLSGFFAAWVTGASWEPAVGPVHGVPLARVFAGLIASALTAAAVLVARASQPAALATSLLVSLGAMPTFRSGVDIMIAVVIVTAVGEPIRRARLRQQQG